MGRLSSKSQPSRPRPPAGSSALYCAVLFRACRNGRERSRAESREHAGKRSRDDDLAAGKESYEYILPDLHEILGVVDPTIDWESVWDVLAKHLSQFREFERGIEVTAPVSAGPAVEGTVSCSSRSRHYFGNSWKLLWPIPGTLDDCSADNSVFVQQLTNYGRQLMFLGDHWAFCCLTASIEEQHKRIDALGADCYNHYNGDWIW